MSEVYVAGLGAVSPAGWGVAALQAALDADVTIPVRHLARPGWSRPVLAREVPAPAPRPAFMGHARLRRSSAITHYAAGAALEALNQGGFGETSPSAKIGLVMCVLCGCVQYTQRFFDETLKDPVTASPLLFPETVFNAPTSHLAVLMGKPDAAITLLGDPAVFLHGLALAAEWLIDGRVEACLVVGAEETNWLLGDALWHFDHHTTMAGGAGALCLARSKGKLPAVALDHITTPEYYSSRKNSADAIRRVQQELSARGPSDLLCDSRSGRPRTDRPENLAWRDWATERVSPKAVLGEGLMAASAWQCVAACQPLMQKRLSSAIVSVAGVNQQAIGARFVACAPS